MAGTFTSFLAGYIGEKALDWGSGNVFLIMKKYFPSHSAEEKLYTKLETYIRKVTGCNDMDIIAPVCELIYKSIDEAHPLPVSKTAYDKVNKILSSRTLSFVPLYLLNKDIDKILMSDDILYKQYRLNLSRRILSASEQTDGTKENTPNTSQNLFKKDSSSIEVSAAEYVPPAESLNIESNEQLEYEYETRSPENEKDESAFEDKEYNLDDELNAYFSQLFEDSNTEEEITRKGEPTSPRMQLLSKKLDELIIDDYLKHKSAYGQDTYHDKKKITLIPIERQPNNKGQNERHFSLLDKNGETTIIYEVYICNNSDNDTYHYEQVQLKTTSERLDDEYTKKTFHIEDPQEDGNRLVFYTFNDECVIINNGILLIDEVRITKKPIIFRFEPDKHDTTLTRLNESLYDLSSLTETQIIQINDGIIDPAQEVECRLDSTTIIIDWITKEPVKRVIYYNKDQNEWKAKVKIYPHRWYLAALITIRDTEQVYDSIPYLALGRYYRDGTGGYKKDLKKAMSYFEKDKSADSYYEMAHIFIDNTYLYDDELIDELLIHASDGGCTKATIEYILKKHKNNEEYEKALTSLKLRAEEGNAVARFFFSCFAELTDKEFNPKETFDFLYSSACDGYKPSQLRISQTSNILSWEEVVDKTEAYQYYVNTINKDNGTLEYCLGGMLLFGWGIADQIELGLFYLKKSVRKKNINAVNDLLQYYTEITTKESNISLIVVLGMILLDNCTDISLLIDRSYGLSDFEHSNESTDSIAYHLLTKAYEIDPDNSTVVNNLGWTLLHGKGCEKDYETARKLFERGIQLDCVSSYYHMGRIWKEGLGVEEDVRKAKEYWEKGAAIGNDKCKKALESLDS